MCSVGRPPTNPTCSGNHDMGREETVPTSRVVTATLLVILVLAYLLRGMLIPIVFAAAIAYAVRPTAEWLTKKLRLPRVAAVLITYLTILLILGVAIGRPVAFFGESVVHAVGQAPQLLGQTIKRLAGPEVHFGERTVSADALAQQLFDMAWSSLAQPGTVLTAGSLVAGLPAGVILTLVVLFYFIASGKRLAEGVLWLAPPRYRAHLHQLALQVDPALRRYVSGIFLAVFYTSLVAWLGLGLAFPIPDAPLIAILVGVLELIPVIGPTASMAIIGAMSLVNGGNGWSFLWGMVFAAVLRVSIGEVVGPFVLGRAVKLHPVVVIIAFLTGATLFGVLGVLLAVPVATSAKIVLGEWYGEDQDG